MEFTYTGYKRLITKMMEAGYMFCSYCDWKDKERCTILRHDVDYDLFKSLQLAQIEFTLGVKSTYFVLVTSNFYNPFSKESYDCLRQIIDLGHNIGLHFDEVRYPDAIGEMDQISELIQKEADILGQAVGRDIDVVSMHRPSNKLINSNLEIPGIVNSYNEIFFKKFKYLSDSRRRWREPIDEIIEGAKYDRIHLLTHAFWYNDEECDLSNSLSEFINGGNKRRYYWLLDNITDLESVINREAIS